eukprot:5772604-Amphidinium_carterae.1
MSSGFSFGELLLLGYKLQKGCAHHTGGKALHHICSKGHNINELNTYSHVQTQLRHAMSTKRQRCLPEQAIK